MGAKPAAGVALVVEDECIVRDDIVGEDALSLLACSEVHVLLTDIQLAGAMNGWEVAHAVRLARPELPVIYASGNTPDPSQQVGGSLFFNKPYDPTDVVAACHQLIAAE